MNTAEYMQRFRDILRKSGKEDEDEVGIVDAARSPDGKFSSGIFVGQAPTLRTNNRTLWILPSASLVSTFGTLGRLMNWNEKATICGIRPSSLVHLAPAELEIALGNTIPVSLAGTILHPILRAWAEALDG